MFLEYLSLAILLIGLTMAFYAFIYLHDLPYNIAKKRNHPQVEAIHTACWLSLFTLHLIWPIVFIWAISNEVLLEYEEIVQPRIGRLRWQQFVALLDAVETRRGNLLRISPHFRFRAIPADADDDKFADCAITADADYIITEDRHFDALIGAGYKPQPITPAEFIRLFLP